jgi:hypothetical protein
MIRNSIEVQTLEKIKKFLSKQKVPVYKGFIVKELGVNLDNLNYALTLIPHQEDHFGRIIFCKKDPARTLIS